MVSNKRIEPNAPYELTTGDVIQLCDSHKYAFVNMNKDSLDDLDFSPPLEEPAVPLAVKELEVSTTDLDAQTDIDYVKGTTEKILPEPSNYHTYCKRQNNLVQNDVPASDSYQNDNSNLDTQNDVSTNDIKTLLYLMLKIHLENSCAI